MYELTELLNNPEDYYPGNFDTPERANALLTGLCQDAANEIAKLQAEVLEQCRINGMSAEREDSLRAEVERLNKALTWEQNRAERIGTHGPGCHTWGPAHYECLRRVTAKLAVALEDLMEATGEPPDRNCSCHISPPCPDCIDYGGWREALENADSARALAKATEDQAGPTTGRTSCNTPVFQNLPLNTPEAIALKQAMLTDKATGETK
jgi:hypothetical protein